MQLRLAQDNDWPALWRILEPVIRAGETYALARDMDEASARSYWLGADKQTWLAELDGAVVGTYYLRANQAGGGSHVCNCGYMTSEAARGKGVARAMCLHSLAQARAAGYRAMQFNFVVSTNERAVRLWQTLGFQTLARVPLAFRHPAYGFVDALVMFQTL